MGQLRFSGGVQIKGNIELFTFENYQIGQSLIFNNDDASYLSRTPGAESDRRTFTISLWTKRGNLGTQASLCGAQNASISTRSFNFQFRSDDTLQIASDGALIGVTDQVFRDPSAWYHFVLAVDTTQSTFSDQFKLWVNGAQVTDFSTESAVTTNKQLEWNDNVIHHVGQNASSDTTQYYDGYIAEFISVDGQALDETSFGEFNSTTGIWQPIDFGGTYGTNGVKLDFADSGDLGADTSGNTNDWTPSNLAASDQVNDSPTNNYCVLSAVDAGTGTLSNGNLDISGSTDRAATFSVSSGKWAWEITANANADYGIVQTELTGTETVYSASTSDVLEFELDMDAGTLDVRVNGGSATSVGTGLSGTYIPLVKGACNCDFGQIDFTPTNGSFSTLNTSNLVAPTITMPSNYFDTVLYTGTGATQSISSLAFQPDFVWIKNRDQADDNYLFDAERGATNYLVSNSDAVEGTDANSLTSFDSTGFSLGTGAGGFNDNGENFVAWCWKEANVDAGFDLVSYTGNGTLQNVSHNLGAVPEMIIVKRRSGATQVWPTYHKDNTAAPETDWLTLHNNNATNDLDQMWNDTAPTSTVFTVADALAVNASGSPFIAYLFRSIEGFSKVSYYTGNASNDGPFVYTGFRPKYILIKRSDGTGGWLIKDTTRSPFNVNDDTIYAHSAVAETNNDTEREMDILSNGFKIRDDNTTINASSTYIYLAFAEYPFKYALAR